jgi:hypothetical protein
MLAKIIACHPAEPGTAQIMIRLRGDGEMQSGLTFTLCNNEQNYLQPEGIWSPIPHWFTVDGGYALGNGTGFRIGPSLLDPLLASPSQVLIQVKLASDETRSTTLQLVRDELFSSDARGYTDNYGSSSLLAAPEPTSAPTSIAASEPELAPIQPKQEPIRKPETRSSRLPVIAGISAVTLLACGALWWFFSRDAVLVAPAVVDKQAEAPVANTAVECSPSNLDSQSELDFVQSCVQQKLETGKLLDIIQAAKEAKKCGVAQRLYANRAQGGDNQVALAYAGEYDPKYHKPSECFKAPDPDTAAYWYETVLQTEPDNQKARQRLEELGK